MQIPCWTCPPPWQDSISHLLKPNTNIKKTLGRSNNDSQFKPKMNQLKLVPIQFKLLLIASWRIIPWVSLILHNNQCQSIQQTQPSPVKRKQHRHTHAQSPSPSNYYRSRNRPQTGATYSRRIPTRTQDITRGFSLICLRVLLRAYWSLR